MSSTNKFPSGHNHWTPDDRPKREDFNNDNALTSAFFMSLVGVVLPYAGAEAPAGFLMCDGQEVSREEYANLFAVIGTTFGSGDGTTTFRVPDMTGRFPLGFDAGLGIGKNGGSKRTSLPLDKNGYARSCIGTNAIYGAYQTVPQYTIQRSSTLTITGQQTNITTATPLNGTTGQGEYLPPYLALGFIIKI